MYDRPRDPLVSPSPSVLVAIWGLVDSFAFVRSDMVLFLSPVSGISNSQFAFFSYFEPISSSLATWMGGWLTGHVSSVLNLQ